MITCGDGDRFCLVTKFLSPVTEFNFFHSLGWLNIFPGDRILFLNCSCVRWKSYILSNRLACYMFSNYVILILYVGDEDQTVLQNHFNYVTRIRHYLSYYIMQKNSQWHNVCLKLTSFLHKLLPYTCITLGQCIYCLL